MILSKWEWIAKRLRELHYDNLAKQAEDFDIVDLMHRNSVKPKRRSILNDNGCNP
jgi:hypothetical protein